MKRLIKANETYTYTLESNILCKEYFMDEGYCDEYTIDKNDEFTNDLKSAVKADMQEMGPKGLAEYLDYNNRKLEKDIIESIIVTIKNNKANANVKATRELTNEELEIVKDYIIAQYADGWGEGFEQHPITIYETEYEVDYDDYEEDDEDSYYNHQPYYEKENVEVCMSFWGKGITYKWI